MRKYYTHMKDGQEIIMNQNGKRTDLAREAVELYNESKCVSGDPDGIRSEEKQVNGINVYTVEILNEQGAEKLSKPIGRYVTVDIDALLRHEDNAFSKTVEVIAAELKALLPPGNGEPVMVVGLGNRAVTPDALGPYAAEKIIATRHLLNQMPDSFSMLRPVTALSPGVLGMTGIESGEIVCGVAEKVPPCVLIAIDALSARRTERLCRTVQLSNTGIAPGSGVGNKRFALNRRTVGVPCIAIGVPTVVDTATLAADILDELNAAYDAEALYEKHGQSFVTSKEVDLLVSECAKVIGYAVNAAVQPELSMEDIELFLS